MTYKQKNYYLLGSAFLLLILSYQFSIKKTITLYQTNVLHQNTINQATNIEKDIQQYNQQLANFNTNTTTSYSQENLLELLSQFCTEHNLLLKGFPVSVPYEESTYNIIENRISVEGDFIDIIELVYDLEFVHKIGSVVSLKFKTDFNRQTKNHYLTSNIFLSTILKQ